jgi:hypothetical protein
VTDRGCIIVVPITAASCHARWHYASRKAPRVIGGRWAGCTLCRARRALPKPNDIDNRGYPLRRSRKKVPRQTKRLVLHQSQYIRPVKDSLRMQRDATLETLIYLSGDRDLQRALICEKGAPMTTQKILPCRDCSCEGAVCRRCAAGILLILVTDYI